MKRDRAISYATRALDQHVPELAQEILDALAMPPAAPALVMDVANGRVTHRHVDRFASGRFSCTVVAPESGVLWVWRSHQSPWASLILQQSANVTDPHPETAHVPLLVEPRPFFFGLGAHVLNFYTSIESDVFILGAK